MKSKKLCVLKVNKLKEHDLNQASYHCFRKIKAVNADGTKNIRPVKLHEADEDSEKLLRKLVFEKLHPHNIRSVRSNAVCAIEIILSASNGFFNLNRQEEFDYNKNFNQALFKKWFKRSKVFLKEKFGNNLLQLQLHFDESTPHLHAFFLPLVDKEMMIRRGIKKGEYEKKMRLCASQILRRRWYYNMHTDYAKAVEITGLKRGVLGTKSTCSDIRKFNKLQAETDRLKHENDLLRKSNMDHANNIVVMQKKREAESLELRQLKSQLLEHKAEISKLSTLVEDYKSDIHDLTKKKETQVAEVTKLIDYKKRQKSEIQALASTEKKHKASITELKTRKRDITSEVQNKYNKLVGPYLSMFSKFDKFAQDSLDKLSIIIDISDGVPGIHQIRRDILSSQSEMKSELHSFLNEHKNSKEISGTSPDVDAGVHIDLDYQHLKQNNTRR